MFTSDSIDTGGNRTPHQFPTDVHQGRPYCLKHTVPRRSQQLLRSCTSFASPISRSGCLFPRGVAIAHTPRYRSFLSIMEVNFIELPHLPILVMTIHAPALPRLSFSSHLRSFVKYFRMVVIVVHPRCTDKPPPPSSCNPLPLNGRYHSSNPVPRTCYCTLSQLTNVFNLVMLPHFPSFNKTSSCRVHPN